MKRSTKLLSYIILGSFIAIVVIAIGFRLIGPEESLTNVSSYFNDSIKGSGKIIEKELPVKPFNSVIATGKFDVFVQSKDSNSILVKTDENIFPHLVIKTDNKDLSLETNPEVSSRIGVTISKELLRYITLSGKSTLKAFDLNPRKLSVTMTGKSLCELNGKIKELQINLSGKSTLKADLPEANSISVMVTGKGHLQLIGKTKNLTLTLQGNPSIDSKKLIAENVSLNSTGRSQVYIHAIKSFSIVAAGSSDIKYLGNPSVTQNTVGDVMIERVNN